MFAVLVIEEYGYAAYQLNISMTVESFIKGWNEGLYSLAQHELPGYMICLYHCGGQETAKDGIAKYGRLLARKGAKIYTDPGLTLYVKGEEYHHPDFKDDL